jgi:integrase
MPRLTDSKIRSAKARMRVYKLFDTDGLFVLIKPSGSKLWRQRYQWAGKERLLGLGMYPQTGLALAREKSAAIRAQVAQGCDPSRHRELQAAEAERAQINTFKATALAWHAVFQRQWSKGHANRVRQRLEDNVFPWIGSLPVREVSSTAVLDCMDRMVSRGAIDTAHRVLQILKKIFNWAIGRGLMDRSPVAHLTPRDHLPNVRVQHRAAIRDPQVFGALLRSIDAYPGGQVVASGLRLLALTFVRPGELRHAQWPEFHLEGPMPTWRIPATRMKMGGADHLVPLSRQAVAVLEQLRSLTGEDGRGYVLQSVRNASRPMSENTFNAALRTMGFTQAQHCSHGFRGTASTLLNEKQWNKDAIELQLSHMPRDETRASYNSADHLPLRRQMMQAWADHLDELRRGGHYAACER